MAFDFDRVGGTIEGNDISTSAGDGIQIHGMGSNGLGALDIVNNHLTSNGGDGISYAQDNRFPNGSAWARLVTQQHGPAERRARHQHP